VGDGTFPVWLRVAVSLKVLDALPVGVTLCVTVMTVILLVVVVDGMPDEVAVVVGLDTVGVVVAADGAAVAGDRVTNCVTNCIPRAAACSSPDWVGRTRALEERPAVATCGNPILDATVCASPSLPACNQERAPRRYDHASVPDWLSAYLSRVIVTRPSVLCFLSDIGLGQC
jgi:hypothetical protein